MPAQDTLARKEQADVVRSQEQTEYYQPAVDIRETPEDVILQFDMPGVQKNNVDLTVDKGVLTVTGKADQEESGTAVYREARVGDYRRQFNLTDDVDPNAISAEMAAGVLTVKIHKPEKAKPKRIQITGGK